MVLVILLSGSVYLSASFGAALFADVDASFDLIFDALGNKAEEPTPPSDMESPEEKPDQTKAESFDSEPEGDCAVGSEGLPESGSVNEGIHGGRTTTAVTTPAAPDPIETVPEAEGTARPRPETTRSPETVVTPETTRSPEWTKNPEDTKAPESTKAPTEEAPSTEPIPETDKRPETTKKPTQTPVPETTKLLLNENEAEGPWGDGMYPPTSEAVSDAVALWRIAIIGSAALCLAVACVFVFRAVRKQS